MPEPALRGWWTAGERARVGELVVFLSLPVGVRADSVEVLVLVEARVEVRVRSTFEKAPQEGEVSFVESLLEDDLWGPQQRMITKKLAMPRPNITPNMIIRK
jgi:hypothetical protein